MINKIKRFALTVAAGATLLAPGLVPAFAGVASADIHGSLCQGTNAAANGTADQTCGNAGGQADTTISSLANKIVNIFSLIVGAVSVIMIIYGGFRYVTSGGDSGRVGNAKNTLIYAIIGLVIVALAQIIVHFVINTTTTASNGIT